MTDEVRNDDASLPMWHAEEILPASGDTPPQPQKASALPPPEPPPAAAPAPPAASRPTPTPTPAIAAARPNPVKTLPSVATPPPAKPDEKKSLVVVAAATAAATTLVLLTVAAAGFFFWSRSDDSDLQTTPEEETATPAAPSDEATTTDEPTTADETEDQLATSDDTADQQPEPADQTTETTEPATPSEENAAAPPADRRAGSAMAFAVAGLDDLGRPVPALPRFLVGTTPDPAQLPNYHPDPERVPQAGPYTVAKGGFFFLRGTVASENIRQELIRRMLLVTSRDSLIIEMAVDENDPWYLDQSVPLYFEDAIRFDVGEADLQIDVISVFLRIAELVALSPEITLEITGHTDNIGSDESNLALSEQRVSQVEEAFVALGAPVEQLVVLALGEADPIASNETEAGRAINRRVEFAILYPEPLDALE